MSRLMKWGIVAALTLMVQPAYATTGYEKMIKVGEIMTENHVMPNPFDVKGGNIYYINPNGDLMLASKQDKKPKVIAQNVKEFEVDTNHIYYRGEESFNYLDLEQTMQEHQDNMLGSDKSFQYRMEDLDQLGEPGLYLTPEEANAFTNGSGSYNDIFELLQDRIEETVKKANVLCKMEYIYRVNLDGSDKRVVGKGGYLKTDDTLDYLLYIEEPMNGVGSRTAKAFDKNTHETHYMHQSDIQSTYCWLIRGDRLEIFVDGMGAIGGTAKTAQFDRNLNPIDTMYIGSVMNTTDKYYYGNNESGQFVRTNKQGNVEKMIAPTGAKCSVIEGDRIYYLRKSGYTQDGTIIEPGIHSINLEGEDDKLIYDVTLTMKGEIQPGEPYIVEDESQMVMVGERIYFVTDVVFPNAQDSTKDLMTRALYSVNKDGSQLTEHFTLKKEFPGENQHISMTIMGNDDENIYLDISESWSVYEEGQTKREYYGSGPDIYAYPIK